jgi:CRISPR-associated protein Csy2
MTSNKFYYDGYLVLPKIKVQNVNCISAPLTWGFPALTSFAGLMVALERRLGVEKGIQFQKFGVVCHQFEPLTNKVGYLTRFNLPRHPVNEHGETSAINEEGRAHMEISLIYKVRYDGEMHSDKTEQLANEVMDALLTLRVAGGTIHQSNSQSTRRCAPVLHYVDENWAQTWRRVKMKLLPGFALVSAQGQLDRKFLAMKETNDTASILDAWLHETRLNITAEPLNEPNAETKATTKVNWQIEKRAGWIVPIPIGYTAISSLQAPGTVANVRDGKVPFQFVEAIYSLGQWVGPHRIKKIDSLLWQINSPDQNNCYTVTNSFLQKLN